MPRTKATKLPHQNITNNVLLNPSSASTTSSTESNIFTSTSPSTSAAPLENINNTFQSSDISTSPSVSTTPLQSQQQQQQQLQLQQLQHQEGFRNPHDKKGRSTSCLLCQKRKQKCDHRLPSCTTCIKAGVKCIQPAKYNVKVPEKDEYTIMLEKKIKFLEKILDVNNIVIDGENGSATKKNFKYKKLSPYLGTPNGQNPNGQNPNGQNPTPNGQNPNGQSISKSDQLIQQPTVDNKIIPIPTNRKLPMPTDELSKKSYLSIDTVDYSNCLFAKYNLKEFLKFDPVFEFDEKLSRAFLDIHFTRLQFKYPLLDEEEIFEFHNSYVTNNLSGYMNNNDFFHYCCCRMWMIFAISSCLHMTTGKYNGPPPARYFSTAIRHITKVVNMNNYQKIEILTLAVLYLIRTDRDSVCLYDIIEDSLKLCMEMKLHKAETYQKITSKEKVSKLRLWWCVYLLERMITIAVGKPYSLSESQVDLELPLFDEEPSAKAKYRRSHHSHTLTNNNIFINQSIKLRRIESRFVEKFHIVGNNDGDDESKTINKNQLPLVEKFFQELEIWRGNCEGFSNGIENETLRLYYYRSVRLLIQPFLELMDPMDKLFRECQAAAGQICQLFKVFHEKTVFGHSTTAIHTVFVAGVTLVYCLWLARNKDDTKRKALGDVSKHTRPTVSEALFNGLNDLRACSICLYVMTERSKFALIFRDTFDQLMTATITNLIERCGPDSSELIYNSNEPGMPPAIVRRSIQENSKAGGFGSVAMNNNLNPTDEEKIEQAERKRKQGQLQKNVVPKSLSHLLINSPPLKPESNENVSQIPSFTELDTPNQSQPPMKKSRFNDDHPIHHHHHPTDDISFSSLQYPGNIYNHSPIPSNVSMNTSAQQCPNSNHSTTSTTSATTINTQVSESNSLGTNSTQQYHPVEVTPFNGRTNTMINNISVWTGESGGPPINTASLFDYNNQKNQRINSNGGSINNSYQNNLDNYLWNVPVEEFWTNNDDYGFLA